MSSKVKIIILFCNFIYFAIIFIVMFVKNYFRSFTGPEEGLLLNPKLIGDMKFRQKLKFWAIYFLNQKYIDSCK